jgi:hypothetical protein
MQGHQAHSPSAVDFGNDPKGFVCHVSGSVGFISAISQLEVDFVFPHLHRFDIIKCTMVPAFRLDQGFGGRFKIGGLGNRPHTGVINCRKIIPTYFKADGVVFYGVIDFRALSFSYLSKGETAARLHYWQAGMRRG